MKLSVDYKKSPAKDGEVKEADIETTQNVISFAISKTNPDGFDGNGPLRRMYGRLQRKMEAAVESGANEFDIETAEVEMVLKALRDAHMPIGWSKFVSALEDALHELQTEPAEGKGDVE